MVTALDLFEQIVRRTPVRQEASDKAGTPEITVHPFELRNVHPALMSAGAALHNHRGASPHP